MLRQAVKISCYFLSIAMCTPGSSISWYYLLQGRIKRATYDCPSCERLPPPSHCVEADKPLFTIGLLKLVEKARKFSL